MAANAAGIVTRVGRSTVATAVLMRLTEVTNRTLVLPLVIFYPTSRCNSRCVSCDWWKHAGDDDLTVDQIDAVAAALPAFGTRLVAFSGGEPLLRPEVFEAAQRFRARGLRLHLLTSGVLLERFADRVAEHFSRVVVSLDATNERDYRVFLVLLPGLPEPFDPSRLPPHKGELNFPVIFDAIDDMGWKGWVGAEYGPGGPTLDSLSWGKPYGIGPKA